MGECDFVKVVILTVRSRTVQYKSFQRDVCYILSLNFQRDSVILCLSALFLVQLVPKFPQVKKSLFSKKVARWEGKRERSFNNEIGSQEAA